jgi:hypothetical protein
VSIENVIAFVADQSVASDIARDQIVAVAPFGILDEGARVTLY